MRLWFQMASARNCCSVRGGVPAASAIGSMLLRGKSESCPLIYVRMWAAGSDRTKQLSKLPKNCSNSGASPAICVASMPKLLVEKRFLQKESAERSEKLVH